MCSRINSSDEQIMKGISRESMGVSTIWQMYDEWMMQKLHIPLHVIYIYLNKKYQISHSFIVKSCIKLIQKVILLKRYDHDDFLNNFKLS